MLTSKEVSLRGLASEQNRDSFEFTIRWCAKGSAFGRGDTITATEVSLAVKTLRAVGCDEIRPEKEVGLLWLARVCQVAW